MAQNVFYQTQNNVGVDPTIYYTNVATAGASVTPEYPAPPFAPGMKAFGSDNSEFIFVQASTSISLTDFVAIMAGTTAAPYQAASVNTVNVWNSALAGIGATGLILKQSVTFIPAGAFFWACTRGQFIPATNSGIVMGALPAGAGNEVALYCALTGVGVGILTSVSTTLSPGIAGIVCINSLTLSTGIAASLVPPSGTLSATGLTIGPVVNINQPRFVTVFTSAAGTSTSGQLSGFGYAL